MPAKLKPSTKEYVKDKNGKMTNKWVWKHYTLSSTSTEELTKIYGTPSYKKKKQMIKRELQKRGIEI
jgi:hypothetical protein